VSAPVRRPVARSNDLWETLRGRRSVRHFAPGDVPRAVITSAIEAAGWAPSPHGTQPWRFVVLESQAPRVALADAMESTWQEQLALDGQDAATIAIRRAKSRERMLDASFLLIACLWLDDLDVYPDPARQEAETTMAVQSLGAAVQNMLLALHQAGVDAGWMCAPLFCPEVVREALGLKPGLIPHAMIPVGFAAKDPVRKQRRTTADLIAAWK
jgi:coenzyme F420-0:L-glutamate ligase/coenzyme F420-1:gamma-L-glutamate ligase